MFLRSPIMHMPLRAWLALAMGLALTFTPSHGQADPPPKSAGRVVPGSWSRAAPQMSTSSADGDETEASCSAPRQAADPNTVRIAALQDQLRVSSIQLQRLQAAEREHLALLRKMSRELDPKRAGEVGSILGRLPSDSERITFLTRVLCGLASPGNKVCRP